MRFPSRSQREQVYTADGSVAAATFLFSRASLRRFDDSPQEHANDEIFYAISPNFSSVVFEDVPLVEFMYLVFTRMPGESYRRRLRSLLLYLCYVFRALINSPVCGFSVVSVVNLYLLITMSL